MNHQSNEAWAYDQVARLPARWCGSLLREWERRRSSFDPTKLTGQNEAQRTANEALRETVARLVQFAVNDDLSLDSSDGDVTGAAWAGAERCRVALLDLQATQTHGRASLRAYGLSAGEADLAEAFEARMHLAAVCAARGIEPVAKKYDDAPAVRRMISARWWTGQLRKAQARALESAAIELGLVNRSRDCYVSNESLAARRAQNERNAAMLEATRAKNLDTLQEFTLAELAAKGPANRAIKRAELMTRISGFERIAIAQGDAGLFLTITCPSKMHAYRIRGGHAVRNPKYDGTKPSDAQKYLSGVWARIRAALARQGMGLYGFRIAEPQHDGTPHWHLLVFYPPANDSKVRSTIRRYALQMDGDEAGAQEKRCDFKTMDPSIGTAAAYIAKYVAKNIDGYRLEKDLIGNDAVETSARVEAWATRWRIRQFQQVGGPPVTVWRELRRVESVPADAPSFVIAVHNAVNKVARFEGRDNASIAWDHYVKAQGGVFCGRNYRVRLATVASDARTAYGEPAPARPIGIEYFEVAKVRDALGNWVDVLPRTVTVESKRFTWEIKRPNARATFGSVRGASSILSYAPNAGGHTDLGLSGIELPSLWLKGEDYDKWATKHPGAAGEWELGLKRAQRAPWTCVNNCTDSARSEADPSNYAHPIDYETTGWQDREAGGGSFSADRRPK